jgi:DNA modification methylase
MALLRQLIESSSTFGETVFDPFGGVLSTAVAAIVSGRKAITCEIDPRYVEIGIERIRAAEVLTRQIEAL